MIASILTVFEVAPVDGAILRDALLSGARDFEDGVTRDPGGFRNSTVRVLTPAAALPLLK